MTDKQIEQIKKASGKTYKTYGRASGEEQRLSRLLKRIRKFGENRDDRKSLLK